MNGCPAFSQRHTLIEILFFLGGGAVVVQMVMVGYAVADFGSPHRCVLSHIKTARISAQSLQWVADTWRAENRNACPTVQRLKDDKQLSAGTSPNDPWGSPWKIFCDGESTVVVSAGPDRDAGTSDDILFPPTP